MGHLEEHLDHARPGSARQRAGQPEAQKHVVVFFLSHRWLRTAGAASGHHPDSEEHVKAQRLVAFAKWYTRMAEETGLRCEVAFWVDYCCSEQADPRRMALGIAALPLYIAACTKVIAWWTPDFDRRCWTMVNYTCIYIL